MRGQFETTGVCDKNLNEFKINFSATNSVHQPHNIDNFHEMRMYSTIVENSSIF